MVDARSVQRKYMVTAILKNNSELEVMKNICFGNEADGPPDFDQERVELVMAPIQLRNVPANQKLWRGMSAENLVERDDFQWTILGHSERRKQNLFEVETDEILA